MTFDDFIALYVCFRDKRDDEILQVTFQMCKIRPDEYKQRDPIDPDSTMTSQHGMPLSDQDYFTKSDLHVMASLVQYPISRIKEIYVASAYSPLHPINFSEFKDAFPKLKNHALFAWVPFIFESLSTEYMNLEKENMSKSYERRLTVQQNELQKLKLSQDQNPDNSAEGQKKSSAKLTSLEVDNIREFYNRDLKNKPAQEVHQIFHKMFKDMKNSKLRKYIFQSVSQVVGLTFVFLAELVLNICKDTSNEQRLTFLFNIFAKQQKQIKGKAIKEFIEIFKLPTQIFKLATFLSLEQYLEELDQVEIDFSALLAAKPMMIAMTAVTPETDDEERDAILAAMNGHKQVETYIYETLPDEQEYYVIEMQFWDQWCTGMAIKGDGKYSIKKEHKDFIDNKGLMEDMHQFRMKDLTYKQDFILLPKYVYYPLAKWYACEKEITRQVIQYRRERKFGESARMGSSQQSNRFLMSSQKFYNAKEGQLEGELVHKKGDFVYELEVYPLIFYLAMVSDKGEKPHSKAVINGKIDFNYLRKVAKTDSLPFEELQVTRKTTLHEVLGVAATTFKQNIKRGRLLVDEQVVHGTTLFQSLEEFGLQVGQLVYAEFSNSSNEFPIDLLNAKKLQGKKKDAKAQVSLKHEGVTISVAQSCGLQNLGNTCYMNSALQVIANIKPIHDYFIRYRLNARQTNFRNPLAFQGQLVNAFSNLIDRMWQSNRQIVPRHFKFNLSRCCEQFSGIDQQDSQEFVSFLTDGLHEELNLRMKKPYIENPDSKDRDVNELGLEQWSNGLLRNWSIIYFLFYGQMRSSLTCRTCKTESTTFDIFSNIPVSLPEPSQTTVSIIVYRVPNRVKDIIQNKIVKDENGMITLQGFQRIDSERDSESGAFSMSASHQGGTLQRMHSSQSNRDTKHLQQFAESYNYMNNDQPMRVILKVDNDIKVRDLAIKISQIRELNIETPLVKTELVVYMTSDKGVLRGLLNPEYKLSQFNLQGEDLMASEILTRVGRETIKKFYFDNTTFIQNHPETVLRCLTYASERGDPIDGVQGYPTPTNQNTPAVKGMFNSQIGGMSIQQSTGQQHLQRPITGESEYDSSSYQSSQPSNFRGLRKPTQKMDKYFVFNAIRNQSHNFDSVETRVDLPRDIFVTCYQRRFIKRSEYIFAQYVPQLISHPLIFCMPTYPSGRRLYDEVWTTAHVMLRPNSRYHRPLTRWWERKNWRDLMRDKQSMFTPFVLKAVDRSGYHCAICHWMKKCNGCIINPTDAPIFEEDLIKKCFIAIEWNSKILSENYSPVANEVVEHASTRKKNNEVTDTANYTSLDDCLTKFTKTEQMDANEVKCEKCKTQQIHYKRIELFIPPPVLIIQLKRFRLFGNQWRKLQNLVDFPIRNLDMTQFCSDATFLKEKLEIEPKYNLHGIVNHYGTLGFGHYVSYTKNPFDSKWYRYDDIYREEVSEENIHKESAYLLFYIRQDLETKELSQIFPNIESDYFVGKPVKIQGKDGFITETMTPGKGRKVEVKLKTNTKPSTVSVEDLTPEEDKNEIVYNANELRRINQATVTDGTEATLTMKKTSRCCGLGKAKGEPQKDKSTTRRGSIKQSGIISNIKKPQEQSPLGRVAPRQQIQSMDPDSSVQDSQSNQPLIKGSGVIGNGQNRGQAPQITSPKVLASARNNPQRQLQMATQDEQRLMVQSQEGALNVVPRPRFRINDGDGHAESILSHFSNSEIEQTEGPEAVAAHGTVSALNNRQNVRLTKKTTQPLEQIRPTGGRNVDAANLTQQLQR